MLMLKLAQSRPDLQDPKGSLENGLTDEAKWKAALSRNHSYDGAFVFALRSTGIYADLPVRPSGQTERMPWSLPGQMRRDGPVFEPVGDGLPETVGLGAGRPWCT